MAIEQAARALFESGAHTSILPGFNAQQSCGGDWSALSRELKLGYLSDVRAVLRAIRDPNTVAIDRGAEAIREFAKVSHRAAAQWAWLAMIDAVLSPDEREGSGGV